MVIEQKDGVIGKKMKSYAKGSVSDKNIESPKSVHAFSEKNNGSMDYLSKTDGQLSKDAGKVRSGEYKYGRYDG